MLKSEKKKKLKAIHLQHRINSRDFVIIANPLYHEHQLHLIPQPHQVN